MIETPEQRSRTMRAVRSRNTGPELAVRRHLHATGLRYRLHDRRLPGIPDLVFPSRRLAVFVNGCFWHQHPGCAAAARSRSHSDYWTRKLDGNVARDHKRYNDLNAAGWEVEVIWECETRDPTALARLAENIRRKTG